MKIRIEVEPLYDNEIQFYDACHGVIRKLEELAREALSDGVSRAFIGQTFSVISANDDAEKIGAITITE